MFAQGCGDMHEWLRKSGRDMSDCGHGTPVQHVERCGLLGDNLIAVHANYLGSRDPALLARRETSVVHCPRSHQYFRHEPFPLERLLKAGVNICLGTDSLASVCITRKQDVELSMFEEMRVLTQAHQAVSPRQALALATLNGARALGMSGQIGEISPGAFADLICIPSCSKTREAYQAVLAHSGAVSGSMIEGKWALFPSSI
jgi:cytosine/adenosine deaminase-related metal-dependent hydrolase